MRKILVPIFLLFLSGLANAQKTYGVLQFNEKIHDFGTIEETGGEATHRFIFRNISEDTVTILMVNASCGCTTPGWTEAPIPPGGAGYIEAAYNPFNRPGNFYKSLTVNTSHPKEEIILLNIKGHVNPRLRTVEDDFPSKLGPLRMKSSMVNMGRVLTAPIPTRGGIKVYNDSEHPVVFTGEFEGPSYIRPAFTQDTLATKSFFDLDFFYDGKARNEWGFVSDQVTVYYNHEGARNPIQISFFSNIEEFFDDKSLEALEKAPKIKISENLYDFGVATQGKVLTQSIKIENLGKSVLNIRHIQTNCECLKVSVPAMDIASGASANMEVIFETDKIKGTQQKMITIFSNDPQNPTTWVTVKAQVKVP